MTGDGLGTVLVVVLSVVAAIGLVALLAIGFVIWRYKVPFSGIIAMFGALIYLLSPIDVLPEAILGPFGLLDDAGVVGTTVLFVYKLVKARQMLADRGVQFTRRRPSQPLHPPTNQPQNQPQDRRYLPRNQQFPPQDRPPTPPEPPMPPVPPGPPAR